MAEGLHVAYQSQDGSHRGGHSGLHDRPTGKTKTEVLPPATGLASILRIIMWPLLAAEMCFCIGIQAMAYANIAALPDVYGLYAALIPIYIYAVFGTSRQLAVGPVALISLLVSGA